MKLNETRYKYFGGGRYDPETNALRQELLHMGVKDFKIREDKTVDLVNNTTCNPSYSTKELMVQFGECHGNFQMTHNMLTTLKGCPTHVYGEFNVSNTQITSFAYAPTFVETNFIAMNCRNLNSLHDIHKQVKHIGGCFYLAHPGEPNRLGYSHPSHILGLLLIKGLKEVCIDNGAIDDIINHHLQTDRDVHLAQDELIDAGFRWQAKL